MGKFLRNKKELIFWLVAVAVFILLVIYAIYAVSFLVGKFSQVYDPNLLKTGEIVKFNLGKIQQLKER